MKTKCLVLAFITAIYFNGFAQSSTAMPVSNADSLLVGTWHHFITDKNAPGQDSINTGMLKLNRDFNFSFTSKLMPGITYTGFFNASDDSLVFLYTESGTVGTIYFLYELDKNNQRMHLKSLDIRRSTISRQLNGNWIKGDNE